MPDYEKQTIQVEDLSILDVEQDGRKVVRLSGKDFMGNTYLGFSKTDKEGSFPAIQKNEVITMNFNKEDLKDFKKDPYSGEDLPNGSKGILKISSMQLAAVEETQKFVIKSNNPINSKTMENEKGALDKSSINEVTLVGSLAQLEKRPYKSGEAEKELHQVSIKVNYTGKDNQIHSNYFNATIPDKHKNLVKDLKVGEEVKLKGFIIREENSTAEKKYVSDKIITTNIQKAGEKESHEAKVKYTGVVVKGDPEFKDIDKIGKSATITLSQSVSDTKQGNEDKKYIYMDGDALGPKYAAKLEGIKKGDVVSIEGALKLDRFENKEKTVQYEKLSTIVFEAQKREKSISESNPVESAVQNAQTTSPQTKESKVAKGENTEEVKTKKVSKGR